MPDRRPTDSTAAQISEAEMLREFVGGALLHSLLRIRQAAFAPEIGVRYTGKIRGDIASACFALEDAARAVLDSTGVRS